MGGISKVIPYVKICHYAQQSLDFKYLTYMVRYEEAGIRKMSKTHNGRVTQYTRTHKTVMVILTFIQNIFIEHLCVTGTVPEAEDIMLIKIDKLPAPMEFTCSMGETSIEQKQ